MKKLTAIILLISICTLILASCKTEESPENNFVNNRFIFQLDNYLLKRYDLVSRKVSVVCPDPLCEHGEECIANKVSSVTITDKFVFFHRGFVAVDDASGYYVYDIEKNTIEAMERGSNHIYLIKNYAYFSDKDPVYDDTGELIERVSNLYRYDTKTKKTEKISSEPIAGIAMVVKYTDSEIYWNMFTNMGGEFYITDYNFENKREWSYEEYIEYCEQKNTVGGYTLENDWIHPEGTIGSGMKIELIDRKGNKELIAEYSAGLRWDNIENRTGFIYQTGSYIPNEKEELEFKSGDKLVYISLIDRSRIFEIDLPEHTDVKVTGFQGCRHYVSEYTSLEAYVTNYGENGEKYIQCGIFVLNTITGENFFIWDESKKYNDKWEEI